MWLRVPGAEAPPASLSVQEVPAKKGRSATPLRVRVIGGGGMVCGVFGWWEVGGGGGGEMVLGSGGGEGRMVFAGDGFAFCFRLVF